MASTSSNSIHPPSDISQSPKRRPGRPVVPYKIDGEITFDDLGPNKNNPYDRMTMAQRQESLENILAEMIMVQRGKDARAALDDRKSAA